MSTGKLTLYTPTLDDLWFRQRMLEDEETMSYNRAWGGTIPWPRERWASWYEHWIVHPEGKRFYRYLKNEDTGNFVGEIAYHLDEQGMCQADVIVFAPCRGQGYGRESLRLPCEAAGNTAWTFCMTIWRRTIRPLACSLARDSSWWRNGR